MREERALARRQRARGTTREVLSATSVAWKAGGCDATELPAEDVGISLCHSPGELLKGEGGIVMGSMGAQPAEEAQAGSVGKEPPKIDGGGSCLVGATHAGADSVQNVAPAGNEGMPIGVPPSRVHAQRRNSPPSFLTAGARQLQALGRGAEVEQYKAALKRYRHDPNRAAANKARRVEDLKSRGARLVKLVIDDLTK